MGKPRSVFSNREVIDAFRNQQKISAYERRNNTKVTATSTVTKSRATKYDNSKGTQVPLGDQIHDIGSTSKRYNNVFSKTFHFGDPGTGDNKITTVGSVISFLSAGSEIFRMTSGRLRVDKQFELDSITAPTSPNNGELWHDSSDNKVYVRSNGVTSEVGAGGGVSNPVNASLDLGGNTIQKVTTLYLNGDGDNSHAITGTIGGLDYNVENTNETHDFGVSGTAKLTVSNTTVSTPVDLLVTGDMSTNSNLVVFGNTTLGNASSDNISMNGTLATDIEMGGNDLDFGTGGTIDFHNIVTSGITGGSASALPSNPTAYFTVKWQGNTRYIPYYS